MKIQIVCRKLAGCDYIRCVLPADCLSKDSIWSATNSIEMVWIGQDEHKIDCDILWYNKLIATSVTRLRQLQNQGMKIIVDIDDHWVLPPGHAHYQGWMTTTQEGQAMSNSDLTVEHIKIADIVVCTSLRLQEVIRQYNKNTIVIPNALPFGQGLYQPGIRESHDKLAFLYAGGVSHLADVQLVSGKFTRIGTDKSITDHAEFILAGYEPSRSARNMYSNVEDYKARNNNYTVKETIQIGPYDHMVNIFKGTNSYRVVPTQSPTKYISVYDQADVSLVPLVGNHWNSMKSELKLLEAASRSIPCIVSNVSPYSDLRPCEGIMWVEKPTDWIDYIKKCIREPNWTKDMGSTLAKWIQEDYNLTKWNEVRKQLFNSLMK